MYDDVTKKKKVGKVVPVAPNVPAKPYVASAPAPEEPIKVREIPRAQPLLMPVPSFQDNGPPVDPEYLKTAAEYLGLLSKDTENPFPKFNMDELKAAVKPPDTTNLPLDLRGLAGLSDTLYGTKLASMTPNFTQDRLNQLKDIKALNSDSQALQQVKGQALLAEYQTRLKEYEEKQGMQSPLQRAQMYEALRKALRGGTAEDLARLRLQTQVMQNNNDAQNRADTQNRDIAADQRKNLNELQREFNKEDIVTKRAGNIEKTQRLRDLLYSPNLSPGTADYAIVIQLLKELDRDSAVMMNEAKDFSKSAGVVDQLINAPNKLFTGGRLPSAQREQIAAMLDSFESIVNREYKAVERSYMERAALAGHNPNDVVRPIAKKFAVDKGRYRFSPADGKGDDWIIPAEKVNKFLQEMKSRKIKVIKRGREE
jgi:hypothetical protein